MLGFAGTVVGMMRTFGELSRTGEPDPEVLAESIAFAMRTTMWGLLVSCFAVIAFAVSLTFFLKRRRLLRAMVDY
jgi:biopolymer transport protein ExbB/TolQ